LTAQRLLAHMRPAPRLSDGFAIHNRRSTAEGRNHIIKDRLAHYGRAAHLDPTRQMLDFLAAARIVNAARREHAETGWGRRLRNGHPPRSGTLAALRMPSRDTPAKWSVTPSRAGTRAVLRPALLGPLVSRSLACSG
jgi:hypothetical protein